YSFVKSAKVLAVRKALRTLKVQEGSKEAAVNEVRGFDDQQMKDLVTSLEKEAGGDEKELLTAFLKKEFQQSSLLVQPGQLRWFSEILEFLPSRPVPVV